MKDPDAILPERALERLAALCARAQIGTIHSFCGNLLREHCAAAALSPDFQIADENQTTALKAATLEKVLEAAYADIDTDEALRALADSVGAGRDDRRLAELILQLYEKMQSHARPEQWAARQPGRAAARGGRADGGLLVRCARPAARGRGEL